jgi:hypothetical protein
LINPEIDERIMHDLESILWRLGSKFVPNETLPDGALEEEVTTDISETARKFGLMYQAERMGWKESKPSTLGIVKPPKGTIPNKLFLDELKGAEMEAKDLTIKVLMDFKARHKIPAYAKANHWKKALRTEGYRWMACDKNLGVKLIKEEEYFKLVWKEISKYDTDFSVDAMSKVLSKRVSNLEEIKLAINGSSRAAKELEELINRCINKERTELPTLKLLLKVHKAKKTDGMFETRPIIPTCKLPEYDLSKLAGKWLAKFAKAIPWVLEDTRSFTDWLDGMPIKDELKTFDFTNLFGNEPVRETLMLLKRGLIELRSDCDANEGKGVSFNDDDALSWDYLMSTAITPTFLKGILSDREPIIMIITASAVMETAAIVNIEDDKSVVISTSKFLAMGSAPVAPMSNIALAILEKDKWGFHRCEAGMRRLIDDVIINKRIIKEKDLRSIYPNYLTLNGSDDSHYLDIEFRLCNGKFVYWPYIKPYPVIPLNWNSNHPENLKKSIAVNELRRMYNNCSEWEYRKYWRGYWRTKFSLADYPEKTLDEALQRAETKKVTAEGQRALLRNIPREFLNDRKYVQWQQLDDKERRIHHVQRWRGVNTGTARVFQKSELRPTRTAWSMGASLQRTATVRSNKIVTFAENQRCVREVVESFRRINFQKQN